MMNDHTMTLPAPARPPRAAELPHAPAPEREPLLREALGEALRDVRGRNGMTLRELSQLAAVSPGYLSELERGRKEVSSELLASVCQGLSVSVADVLIEAAGAMALHAARPEMAAI
ncbi:helix-turn-helix domain-containing protein [Corynebacterium sphenisci]|uniref:helix-turn-helix domain-containing protein n=1 Tax=Corynebacterium sphenisci TaxID=191493 RepID=UPI003F65D98B